MSLRVAAKLIRSQIKVVIKTFFSNQSDYSYDQFLDACEKAQPSQFLVTGGALMEFFIMTFGAADDSRLLFRYTSDRKRDQMRVVRSQSQIQHLMQKYTLRYLSDDLFSSSFVLVSFCLGLFPSWR